MCLPMLLMFFICCCIYVIVVSWSDPWSAWVIQVSACSEGLSCSGFLVSAIGLLGLGGFRVWGLGFKASGEFGAPTRIKACTISDDCTKKHPHATLQPTKNDEQIISKPPNELLKPCHFHKTPNPQTLNPGCYKLPAHLSFKLERSPNLIH